MIFHDLTREPISRIEWREAASLKANNYNPNCVFTPELRLLERSILLTGFVQPILITADGTIIDGFHRVMLSLDSSVLRARYSGKVPCAVLDVPRDKAMVLTIRMNRAKGSHVAVRMSEIVPGAYRRPSLRSAGGGDRDRGHEGRDRSAVSGRCLQGEEHPGLAVFEELVSGGAQEGQWRSSWRLKIWRLWGAGVAARPGIATGRNVPSAPAPEAFSGSTAGRSPIRLTVRCEHVVPGLRQVDYPTAAAFKSLAAKDHVSISDTMDTTWFLFEDGPFLVLGVCALMRRATGGRIKGVWVRPEHRGKGIGRQMTLALIEHAVDHMLCFRLEALAHNPAFYEGLGWERIGAPTSNGAIWLARNY